MAKGSHLNRKEMKKEGTLEYHEGRKNMVSKKWATAIAFVSPLEFSKLFLMVEAKITTLSNVVLNVCRRNI